MISESVGGSGFPRMAAALAGAGGADRRGGGRDLHELGMTVVAETLQGTSARYSATSTTARATHPWARGSRGGLCHHSQLSAVMSHAWGSRL